MKEIRSREGTAYGVGRKKSGFVIECVRRGSKGLPIISPVLVEWADFDFIAQVIGDIGNDVEFTKRELIEAVAQPLLKIREGIDLDDVPSSRHDPSELYGNMLEGGSFVRLYEQYLYYPKLVLRYYGIIEEKGNKVVIKQSRWQKHLKVIDDGKKRSEQNGKGKDKKIIHFPKEKDSQSEYW